MVIKLYEDNAGHLELHVDDGVTPPIVWADLEMVDSLFAQDCAAIEKGDTHDWTVPIIPGLEGLSDPVAIYIDGRVDEVNVKRMGDAAHRYIFGSFHLPLHPRASRPGTGIYRDGR